MNHAELNRELVIDSSLKWECRSGRYTRMSQSKMKKNCLSHGRLMLKSLLSSNLLMRPNNALNAFSSSLK